MSLPPSYNLLKQHLNPVYVETGIWRADSLRLAIDAGFETVIGIDYFPENITFCMSRFRMKSPTAIVDGCTVFLFSHESHKGLATVLKSTKEPATFFLDAHSQFLEDETEAPNPYPLLLELMAIKEYGNPQSTIIIDDILHLSHPDVTGWTRNTIEYAVKAINPDYKISYIANPVRNNLLVAIP